MIHVENEVTTAKGKTKVLCAECAAALTQVSEILAKHTSMTTPEAIQLIASVAIAALPEWRAQKESR